MSSEGGCEDSGHHRHLHPSNTPPAIFYGDSDLGKIFFDVFWGIEPTTPTPTCRAYYAATALWVTIT
jgi:hypothetical protein